MKMTRDEMWIAAGVFLALVLGMAIRQYRQTHSPANSAVETGAKSPVKKR